MSEYCTVAQVTARLTEVGKLHVADRDRSGNVSAAESATTLDTVIVKAGGVIDFAIGSFCPPATARAQAAGGSVPWLVDRAVELACYWACTTGGATAPESVKADYDQCMLWMTDVRENQTPIPGLVVPRPYNSGCRHVGVMVVNPR